MLAVEAYENNSVKSKNHGEKTLMQVCWIHTSHPNAGKRTFDSQ